MRADTAVATHSALGTLEIRPKRARPTRKDIDMLGTRCWQFPCQLNSPFYISNKDVGNSIQTLDMAPPTSSCD